MERLGTYAAIQKEPVPTDMIFVLFFPVASSVATTQANYHTTTSQHPTSPPNKKRTHRSPSQIKHENVNHDHRRDNGVHHLAPVFYDPEGTAYNERSAHDDHSVEQKGTTAIAVDEEEGDEDAGDFEDVDDNGHQECIILPGGVLASS